MFLNFTLFQRNKETVTSTKGIENEEEVAVERRKMGSFTETEVCKIWFQKVRVGLCAV
jgi:hypothetical protein